MKKLKLFIIYYLYNVPQRIINYYYTYNNE